MAERDAAGSSARRRRERRLRLAPREVGDPDGPVRSHAPLWHVSNAALRGQKPDRAGVRPPSLGKPPGPAVGVSRGQQPGTIEQPFLDVPVLQTS